MKPLAGVAVAAVVALHGAVCLAEEPPALILQWGSRGTANGQFQTPTGLGIDPGGNVYATDRDATGAPVQKFASDGTFLARWGTYGIALGELQYPGDVAVDPAGRLFVADNGDIQVFDQAFSYLYQWSVGTARAIAVDPSGERVLIKVRGGLPHLQGRLVSYQADGSPAAAWVYAPEEVPGGLGVGQNGEVYIGTGSLNQVRVFSKDGVLLRQWGSPGTDPGMFQGANAVAVDASDNVYVADGTGRIQKFTSAGVFVAQWPVSGEVTDMVADHAGNVYVLDAPACRITKYGHAAVSVQTIRWGFLKASYRN